MWEFLFNVNFLLICNICAASFSHYGEDYVTIDDLPLQDARLVRADGTDRKEENVTTQQPFAGGVATDAKDTSWTEEALKDIAYYLRSHKYNEYDRRYESNGAPRHFHEHFPRPALRNLHWEVHKYCDESFLACIEYLWQRIKLSGFRRSDDTYVIMQEQHWTIKEHKAQIDKVDAECRKLMNSDDVVADPFQGPLERFQWRTTASYYMCWYTMMEVENLRHLLEPCDNFAHCLDSNSVSTNKDYRANDDEAFSCSTYSFCPDPCCGLKLATHEDQCWNSDENPCYAANPPGMRKCKLKRLKNRDFSDIILNRWNVSCNCSKPGYMYDASYGICVDIDECTDSKHVCKKEDGQACLNMLGSYKCVCKWGFTWDKSGKKCTQNEAIAMIKMDKAENQTKHKNIEMSYLRYYFKKLFENNVCCKNSVNSYMLIFMLLIIFV